jgi:hypothetical protein
MVKMAEAERDHQTRRNQDCRSFDADVAAGLSACRFSDSITAGRDACRYF